MKSNRNNFFLTYRTKREAITILTILHAYGYTDYAGMSLDVCIKQECTKVTVGRTRSIIVHYCYSSIAIDYSHGRYDREDLTELDVNKVEDFLRYLEGNDNTVNLNDEYTAVVTKTSIQVGCQTIPMKAFDELATVVERIKKS